MPAHILILDTGKEWGGGTNSLLELLSRIDRGRYCFSALFYYNYKKGNESDIKREMEKLGVNFLQIKQKKDSWKVKLLKEAIRFLFFYSKTITRYIIFWVNYHCRIKKNARRVYEILQDLRIDLLYLNNQPSSNLEGILAAQLAEIPAVQHSRIKTELNAYEVNTANAGLKKMVCVSEGIKNDLIRQGIDAAKCVVVYNGIDAALEPQIPPEQIRQRYGILPGEVIIGSAGSLIKRKQMGHLIQALARLQKRTEKPLKGLILGAGPEEEALRREIHRLNLADNVSLPGFVHPVLEYINAMDIFVFPSQREGFPRVIIEAMLMGKPVVAYQIAGLAESVVDGETGYLVPAQDLERLTQAILRLAENPELRQEMGEKGRLRVIENFSMERYIRGVDNVFGEVLGQ
jgi:glycosyltransferase involved in cell wall biosynthesis